MYDIRKMFLNRQLGLLSWNFRKTDLYLVPCIGMKKDVLLMFDTHHGGPVHISAVLVFYVQTFNISWPGAVIMFLPVCE